MELHNQTTKSIKSEFILRWPLKQLQDVIGFDMGDIQIYNPDTEMLFSYAQIGNPPEETSEVKDWKSKIVAEAIYRKETFFFDYTEKGTDAQTRLANNFQEVLAITLKTKGEIHGALIIYTRTGRSFSKEDRTLLEGISEAIAGGIGKIKAEEEWRLKANALEIASSPIYMTNMGGKLTYINPAFLELWGYDRDGVVLGRPYTELWKGETENVVIMACEKGSWEGDLIALRKDGSKFNARLSTSLIMGKIGPSQLVAVAEPEN